MGTFKAIVVFLVLFLAGNFIFALLAWALDLKHQNLAVYMITASFLLSLMLMIFVSQKIGSNKKKRLFKK